MPHQTKARGPGLAQIRTRHQLAGVEVIVWVDLAFVVLKRCEFRFGQKLIFRQANAVLA